MHRIFRSANLLRYGVLLIVAAATHLACPPLVLAQDDVEPTGDRNDSAFEAQLGAARWLPADASYFSAGYRLGQQWRRLVESRAVGELLQLPLVQQGLMQLNSHPAMQQFRLAR